MMISMQITTLRARPLLWLAVGLGALAGCVYQMPIQQGNYLDATALVQVRKGMTRAQVRYLLGTPQVPGGFDNDRWDYDYYLKLQHLDRPRRARAAVYFHNDVVDHLDSDVMPVASDVANNTSTSVPSAAPAASPPETPVTAPAAAPTATPSETPATAPAAAPTAPPSEAPVIGPAATPEAAPAAAPPSVPSPVPQGAAVNPPAS
jgi:outer membrane protein assembly factor BamE